MTFVGKILLVIQLVLSILFVAFAGAVFSVQESWKTSHEQMEQDWKSADKAREEFAGALGRAKKANKDLQDSLTFNGNAAAKKLDDLQKKYDTTKSLYDQVSKEQDTYKTVSELEGREARFRHDEAIEQRRINESMHQKLLSLVDTNRQLSGDKFELNLVLDEFKRKHLLLFDDLKTVEAEARRKGRGLGAPPSEDVVPPPPISGKVLSARYGKGNRILYVEISLGGDDGIREGQRLTVWRSGDEKKSRTKYLGQIRVINVHPDKAVGTVTSKDKAKNGVIRKGDNVTSKL